LPMKIRSQQEPSFAGDATGGGRAKQADYPGWVKQSLLWLAVVRGLLAAVAVPLVPVLYRHHFEWLLVLRPAKEILAIGGFMVRRGWVDLGLLVLLGTPLALLGVWQFFWTGKVFAPAIKEGNLPRPLARVLPAKRIRVLSRILQKRGASLVMLGRIAIFPSSLLAATAGAFGMSTRRFLWIDAVGGVISTVKAIAIGYLLGRTYEDAGFWVTVIGAVALVVLLGLMGHYLHRDKSAVDRDGEASGSSHSG